MCLLLLLLFSAWLQSVLTANLQSACQSICHYPEALGHFRLEIVMMGQAGDRCLRSQARPGMPFEILLEKRKSVAQWQGKLGVPETRCAKTRKALGLVSRSLHVLTLGSTAMDLRVRLSGILYVVFMRSVESSVLKCLKRPPFHRLKVRKKSRCLRGRTDNTTTSNNGNDDDDDDDDDNNNNNNNNIYMAPYI